MWLSQSRTEYTLNPLKGLAWSELLAPEFIPRFSVGRYCLIGETRRYPLSHHHIPLSCILRYSSDHRPHKWSTGQSVVTMPRHHFIPRRFNSKVRRLTLPYSASLIRVHDAHRQYVVCSGRGTGIPPPLRTIHHWHHIYKASNYFLSLHDLVGHL